MDKKADWNDHQRFGRCRGPLGRGGVLVLHRRDMGLPQACVGASQNTPASKVGTGRLGTG